MNIETTDGRLGSEGGMCKWMLRPRGKLILGFNGSRRHPV
jgi:hypothetical protein